MRLLLLKKYGVFVYNNHNRLSCNALRDFIKGLWCGFFVRALRQIPRRLLVTRFLCFFRLLFWNRINLRNRLKKKGKTTARGGCS